MIKRTTGRLLLTLLVVTGLAGTLNNGAISLKERKRAITLIKSSRIQFFNSIRGLSAHQLKFKRNPSDPSINDLVMDMVSFEKKCQDEIKAAMNQSSNPEARLQIALTDDQLLANDSYSLCRKTPGECHNAGFGSADEALRQFNLMRDHQIRYIRNSTEDLRNHVVKTFAGWIDCYQYYLLVADRSSYVTSLINEIRSAPNFPKK
jgi:hypothetical protein